MTAMRPKPLDDRVLESEVMVRLDRALAERWVKVIYQDPDKGKPSYMVFSDRLERFWRDFYPNGDPVTDWKQLTREEFLDEFRRMPYGARFRIYQSLQEGYTPPPEKASQSRIPENLFGL